MNLTYLLVNSAWCVTFGDSIIPIGGQMIFDSRQDVESALAFYGLAVRKGSTKIVTVD